MNLQPVTIPKEQIWQRWNIIPENLRDELISEKNAAIVSQTCTAEHLSEEKYAQVARIISWVLLGFLHPEDVANEIKLSTGVHPEIANRLATTLNTKIFGPLHDQLEDSFAPAGTHPEENREESPVRLEDIKSPESTEQFESTLEKLRPESGENSFFKETPAFIEGSSSLRQSSSEASETKPITLEGLDKLGEKSEPEVSSPFPPQSSPFIIHEEPAAPSLPQIENFKLDTKPEEYGPSAPEMQPIPQANIEIGNTAEETRDERQEAKKKQSRVVHYGDLKSPLDSFEADIFSPDIDQPPTPPTGELLTPPADEPPTPPEATSTDEVLPPPPPPPPRTSRLGFFARLFGKKKPQDVDIPLPPTSGSSVDLPPPPTFVDIPPPPQGSKVDIAPSLNMDEPPKPPPPKFTRE